MTEGSAKAERTDLGEAKRHVLLGFLMTGPVVGWVDVNRAGVVLPDTLKEDLHVKLNYLLDEPALELEITAAGIFATIVHMGSPFRTFVPWPALFTISTDHGIITWPEPEEPNSIAPLDESGRPDDGPIPEFVANVESSAPVPTTRRGRLKLVE